jgi:hypothetical protein
VPGRLSHRLDLCANRPISRTVIITKSQLQLAYRAQRHSRTEHTLLVESSIIHLIFDKKCPQLTTPRAYLVLNDRPVAVFLSCTATSGFARLRILRNSATLYRIRECMYALEHLMW